MIYDTVSSRGTVDQEPLMEEVTVSVDDKPIENKSQPTSRRTSKIIETYPQSARIPARVDGKTQQDLAASLESGLSLQAVESQTDETLSIGSSTPSSEMSFTPVMNPADKPRRVNSTSSRRSSLDYKPGSGSRPRSYRRAVNESNVNVINTDGPDLSCITSNESNITRNDLPLHSSTARRSEPPSRTQSITELPEIPENSCHASGTAAYQGNFSSASSFTDEEAPLKELLTRHSQSPSRSRSTSINSSPYTAHVITASPSPIDHNIPLLDIHSSHDTTSLPYPITGSTVTMPEERDHQFMSGTARSETGSSSSSIGTAKMPVIPETTIAPGIKDSMPSTTAKSRQSSRDDYFSTRQSLKDEKSSTITTSTTDSESDVTAIKVSNTDEEKEKKKEREKETETKEKPIRKVSFDLPTKSSSSNTSRRAKVPHLPPCPRSDYKSGYKDWYNLEGCPNFDLCPDCRNNVFEGTRYSSFFKRPREYTRPLSVKVRCDFSNPWMRLAWLLTLERRLPDLSLLQTLYKHLDESKDCPDARKANRRWMTIVDYNDRRPIRKFHVCPTDVKSIEILLPGLKGHFVDYPKSSISSSTSSTAMTSLISSTTDQTLRKCTLYTTRNNRFPSYLDSLVSIHESLPKGVLAKSSDMRPFTELVKYKTELADCPRDNMMKGKKWFFIPTLPEFTVCEECHDDMIVPIMNNDYNDDDLTLRFHKTPQFLPLGWDGPSGMSTEASCTLYSPRMRRIFSKAVRNNDYKYLCRKAKERREREVELQQMAQPLITTVGEIDALLKRVTKSTSSREIARLEDDRARWTRKIKRYRDDWTEVE